MVAIVVAWAEPVFRAGGLQVQLSKPTFRLGTVAERYLKIQILGFHVIACCTSLLHVSRTALALLSVVVNVDAGCSDQAWYDIGWSKVGVFRDDLQGKDIAMFEASCRRIRDDDVDQMKRVN